MKNKRNISLVFLIMIISGIFGFIYETIFYRIDLGYFVKRGSTFGPWIPIYAFGGVLITLTTYKFKKKPLLVFIISSIVTGLLEYLTGYILYEYFNLRLWDYNKEIWNFGNINGYICLRSIIFFGLSSLFLVYILIPNLKKLIKNIKDNTLLIISSILAIIFFTDCILYIIIK